MNLNLHDKKVLVTGGQDAARVIGEAFSQGLIDVAVWVRDVAGITEPANVMPHAEVVVASARPEVKQPRASLWRETMGY
ncbi:MAG TPA: hypothetical protein VE031_08525 [Chthoniobacterales bacterium]|nr:hypothetical protein [Chthoniobacterales bacterium]